MSTVCGVAAVVGAEIDGIGRDGVSGIDGVFRDMREIVDSAGAVCRTGHASVMACEEEGERRRPSRSGGAGDSSVFSSVCPFPLAFSGLEISWESLGFVWLYSSPVSPAAHSPPLFGSHAPSFAARPPSLRAAPPRSFAAQPPAVCALPAVPFAAEGVPFCGRVVENFAHFSTISPQCAFSTGFSLFIDKVGAFSRVKVSF